MKRLVSLLIRITGFSAPPQDMQSPTSASVSVVEPLSYAVSGLDIKNALARMSGMRSLYVRTARDFDKILGNVIQELKDYLATGQRPRLQMLLHTLKGNAGTLGATALAHEAAKLEAVCKAGQDLDPEVGSGLQALEAEVIHAQSLFKEAIAKMDPPADTPVVRVESVVAPEVLSPVLEELHTLIRASDMTALQRFAEVRVLLQSLPNALDEQLDEALQALDFEKARLLCVTAMESLQPR